MVILWQTFHQTKILFKVRKPTKITLQLDKYNKLNYYFKMEQLLYMNSCYYNLLVNTKKKR